MLAVEGLVKRFGGFTAVSNVSFKVDQGEILGLIGPNGSGKSTIFNMLSGTFPPTAGSITFEGHEIAGLPPHRIINRGIGRTFQIPRPFRRLTLFENVALAGFYGQGRHSAARANEAAERGPAMVGLPTDRPALVDGRGAAGFTIRWGEHMMGVLRRVGDRVVVLDQGEKVCEGLPSAVSSGPRVIEVYLGTDAVATQAAAAVARR